MQTLNPIRIFAFVLAFSFSFILNAQETESGLPGDHFSLEGALQLFKKSKSPEDFEKKINKESNHVNNLDLNEDGEIDYIRVIDNMDGEVHAMVLQAVVSESESQDIAVIEIEKNGPESAMLQIVGDEDIYGQGAIIEPYEEDGKGGGGGSPYAASGATAGIFINVWGWPCVGFVYAPTYSIWISPFRWRVYPRWWRPWRPFAWSVHRRHVVHYHVGVRIAPTHRVVRAHTVYAPRRTSSKVVVSRTTVKRTGGTKVYRKSTVVANNKGVAGKRTTTKVAAGKTKNGKTVVGRKTTTQVRGKGANKTVAGKKTTTQVGVKGKNGRTATAKRSTTQVRGKGRNASYAGKKKSTTVKARGKRGSVGARKTTKTGVKKRRRN